VVDIKLVGLTHVLDYAEDDEVSLIVFESVGGDRLELVVTPQQAYEVMDFPQSLGGRVEKSLDDGETDNIEVPGGLEIPDSGEPFSQL
jgi:hypothetical protein